MRALATLHIVFWERNIPVNMLPLHPLTTNGFCLCALDVSDVSVKHKTKYIYGVASLCTNAY